MEITIREYREGEREVLVKGIENLQNYIIEVDPLKRLVSSEEQRESYTDKLLKAVSEREGKIYLAQEGEEVVGFIVGTIQPEPTGGTLESIPSTPGWIRELYVDEKMRGRGVGKLLIKTLEDYFKSKNCDTVLVGVFTANTLSHNFYETNGYVDREVMMLKKI